MTSEWKIWIKRYSDGLLSHSEFWNYLVPELNEGNVSEVMSRIREDSEEEYERFRESSQYADPDFISSSSHWPIGPTSENLKNSIIAVKNFFQQEEKNKRGGSDVS